MHGFEFKTVVGVKMQTTPHYCPPLRSNGLSKSNCFLDKLCCSSLLETLKTCEGEGLKSRHCYQNGNKIILDP